MSDEAQYPACEQLAAVAPFSQHIGDFLDWLTAQGIVLAKYGCPHGYITASECEESKLCRRGDYTPILFNVTEHPTNLLARFYEVDLAEVDRERRAALDAIRNARG